MISQETARQMAHDQAAEAAQKGQEPFLIWQEDIEHINIKKVCQAMPFLGDYLPEGWQRVSLESEEDRHGVYIDDNEGFGAYFVDSSGFGQNGEPALNPERFVKEYLEPGFGYAIVEAGQFQVRIGKFKKDKVCYTLKLVAESAF